MVVGENISLCSTAGFIQAAYKPVARLPSPYMPFAYTVDIQKNIAVPRQDSALSAFLLSSRNLYLQCSCNLY